MIALIVYIAHKREQIVVHFFSKGAVWIIQRPVVFLKRSGG